MLLNRSQAAELLDVSLPTMDVYVKRGCPFVQRGSKGKEWQFSAVDIVKWARQQDVEKALGDIEVTDFEEGRRRKVVAEAQIAEYELAKLRRTMIHVQDVQAVVSDEYGMVRSRLFQIPGRLAQMVAVETDASIIEGMIKAEVADALEELSADGGRSDDGPGSV
jgi:phage terminase Nu1 subunit (DNA packaging protein)